MEEIWEDIIGYEGLYKISNLGRIISISRFSFSGRLLKEKFRKLNLTKKNYYNIILVKDGNYKSYQLHRLLAINFIPNPNNYPCVNHIDGNSMNNSLDNLEWVTYRENNSHRFITNPSKSKYTGVYWNKACMKWASGIMNEGKVIHLGTFNNELDAYNARVKYERDNNILNKYL